MARSTLSHRTSPIWRHSLGPERAAPASFIDLVSSQLGDPHTSWAVGTFGAIAEFHRDAGEPVALSAHGAVTARGGIRLQFEPALRIIAWERPGAGDGWMHGIALCLPAIAGAMSGRTTVAELGPDDGALQEEDREAVLFDLGIGAPHCDICVRTADTAILRSLRAAVGQSVLATALLREIPAMSPTRVFMSRLGRVEVRTPIPKPDGTTPDGPHTHVLPDLLRLRRTHSSNVPLPAGVVPSVEIFPASAIHDEHGKRAPFAASRHEAFQSLLAVHGDPACSKTKSDTFVAVRAAEPPRDVPSYSRAQRLARRVALRQLVQTDGLSPALTAWRAKFDRQS
jgi:hypothetical protein